MKFQRISTQQLPDRPVLYSLQLILNSLDSKIHTIQTNRKIPLFQATSQSRLHSNVLLQLNMPCDRRKPQQTTPEEPISPSLDKLSAFKLGKRSGKQTAQQQKSQSEKSDLKRLIFQKIGKGIKNLLERDKKAPKDNPNLVPIPAEEPQPDPVGDRLRWQLQEKQRQQQRVKQSLKKKLQQIEKEKLKLTMSRSFQSKPYTYDYKFNIIEIKQENRKTHNPKQRIIASTSPSSSLENIVLTDPSTVEAKVKKLQFQQSQTAELNDYKPFGEMLSTAVLGPGCKITQNGKSRSYQLISSSEKKLKDR